MDCRSAVLNCSSYRTNISRIKFSWLVKTRVKKTSKSVKNFPLEKFRLYGTKSDNDLRQKKVWPARLVTSIVDITTCIWLQDLTLYLCTVDHDMLQCGYQLQVASWQYQWIKSRKATNAWGMP